MYLWPVLKNRLMQEGLFDMKEIYDNVKTWATENEYDYYEPKNVNKEKTKGDEIDIKIKLERRIDNFVKFVIWIEFFVIEVYNVKFKNRIAQNGKFEMRMKVEMHLDYRERWSKNWFSKFLLFVYWKRVLRRKLDKVYEVKLYEESTKLFNVIKDSIGHLT